MKRNAMWIVTMVAGLSACGGAKNKPNPLQSPLGEVQTAGAPKIVVRISEQTDDNDWIKDMYGKEMSNKDIVKGDTKPPAAAKNLMMDLNRYSSRK